MKKIITITGLIILVLGVFIVLFFNTEKLDPDSPKGKTTYYTIINNENVDLNNDNRYQYVLACYDEKGHEKNLNFTAGKELKEGAYIKLYHAPLRGVTYWEEIGEDDLPAKVKAVYIK